MIVTTCTQQYWAQTRSGFAMRQCRALPQGHLCPCNQDPADIELTTEWDRALSALHHDSEAAAIRSIEEAKEAHSGQR